MTVIANTKLINVRGVSCFFNPVSDISTKDYYVFVGNHTSNTAIPISESVKETEYTAFEQIIFGKFVTTSDYKRMINRYEWQSGKIYAQYDDTDANLYDKEFFVSSPEGGSYHIFKCLNNNGGVPSTSQPLFSETSEDDEFYVTADKYVWKYMYSVDSVTYDKFKTHNYIPVIPNANVAANAISGSIDSILLVTGGSQYKSIATGGFSQISVSNTTVHALDPNSTSSNTNFYTGSAIYINSGTGFGQVREITNYLVTANQHLITIDNEFAPQPDLTSSFVIAPNVKILGDGSGAQAISVVNQSTNSIERFEIISSGQNYTYANVSIVGNTGITQANNAVARAIISPRNGHGANVYSELYANKIGISVKFNNTEFNSISSNNSFSRVGLLKAPQFANVTLNFATSSGAFIVNESVSQNNASGVVTAANSTAVQLTEVSGRFSTGLNVVGANSGATANVTLITGQPTTINQTLKLLCTYNSGSFSLDDYVEQETPGVNGAFGYIQDISQANATHYNISLTGVKGVFETNKYIKSSNGVVSANVVSITNPDLIPYTGDIVYLETINPISRSNTQSETIKFVLKFY